MEKVIKITLNLSSETMEARGKVNIFQMLKEKNCQPRILYLLKIFRNKGEIKALTLRTKKICYQQTYPIRMVKVL